MNVLRIPLRIVDKRVSNVRFVRRRVVANNVQRDVQELLDSAEVDVFRSEGKKKRSERKLFPFPELAEDDEPAPLLPLNREARLQRRRPEKQLFKMKFDHIPVIDQAVVMFPDLGTQHLRMGEKVIDNPSSRRLFEEANELLNFDLLDLCLNGPVTKLDKIEHAHMAIFVSSIAAFEKLKTEQTDLMERMTECAGFGLGEFCSLVAAEMFTYSDVLKMVKIYADAAQQCSQLSYSGMLTVRTCAQSLLLKALEEARQFSESKGERPLCELAAYLFPHVKVIAGTVKSLEFLVQHADHFKIQITKRLPIYGAFHTSLMDGAAKEIAKFLEGLDEIKLPRMNVYSNYTGRPHAFKVPRIKRDIVRQITNPVKWEQIAQLLFAKHKNYVFPSYFEVGTGTQLGQILYHIGKKTRKTYLHYPA